MKLVQGIRFSLSPLFSIFLQFLGKNSKIINGGTPFGVGVHLLEILDLTLYLDESGLLCVSVFCCNILKSNCSILIKELTPISTCILVFSVFRKTTLTWSRGWRSWRWRWSF